MSPQQLVRGCVCFLYGRSSGHDPIPKYAGVVLFGAHINTKADMGHAAGPGFMLFLQVHVLIKMAF